MGSYFGFCQLNFAKPLEITFFSSFHIDLRLGKLYVLPKIKYKTVGNAHAHVFTQTSEN